MRRYTDDVNKLMTEPNVSSLAELYHENSKLRKISWRQYGEFVSLITSIPHVVEKMARSCKSYPTAPQIALPDHFEPNGPSLETVIQKRRTLREFSGRPLVLDEIARLLHFSYGVTGSAAISQQATQRQFFRAAPSAGALYPLEIYLVVWNVVGLEPGIYHYHTINGVLECLKQGDFCEIVGEYTISKDLVEKACVLCLVTAVFQRTMFKYQERGYRFVLLDAGHMAQNMCLMAAAMNLGIIPIGAFLDDELNRLLGIDGVNESVIYPLLVGRAG